jgi:hypothetical protein
MNHQKVYESIILNAKSQDRKKLKKVNENYIYYENHHTIPRCVGGTNDKENLVLLTAREHFICHKLLTYIYPNNSKLAYAFYLMSFINKYKEFVSSRDYAYTKELFCLCTRKGMHISNEHKKIIGNITRGKTYDELYGSEKAKEKKNKTSSTLKRHIISKETREKIRNTLLGRPIPEEVLQKRRLKLKGKKHIMKERTCPFCGLSGKGPSMTMYHFNNCKFKTI